MLRAPALRYVWYPLLTVGAIAMHWSMLAGGAPLAVAAYAPLAVVALSILWLQIRCPARASWQPTWADVKTDAAFLLVVQVLLPRILLGAAVLVLADWAHASARNGWWPHAWPVIAQTLAIVLTVDFLRYWLHRACHRFDWLWRLHQVHHATDLLYALNTGRFHPLEKTLHFCCDTLPFLLLGVAPEPLAGYFLVYSVNGFFQHSNVKLRYGWLNYVVGSAETHRWHHAKDPRIANCNFGSTTMLWDLVFGTWYLPRGKTVPAVGILDERFPSGFWPQLLAPFQRGGAVQGSGDRLADALLGLGLPLLRAVQGWRIAAAARDPMRVQRQLLERIVRENRETSFGRQHGFERIDDYRQFIESVPVRQYESLRPFIEAEIEHGDRALTDRPAVRYVRTSGTTARPKDVPLTAAHLRALRWAQRTGIAFQHGICPKAFSGAILAIVSPAREGTLANGKGYGAASGIVAESVPALLRRKFVVPQEVFAVAHSEVKYLLILRLALARPDLTYLGTANATTVLTLLKLYREHAGALAQDIQMGTFFLAHRVPAEAWSAVRARLTASPERAAELRRLHEHGHQVRAADLWPALRLVVTWTRASAGIAVKALRQELSTRTRILELGYLASEFRGTVTLGRSARTGWPTLATHFFEFVERARWDEGAPEYLTLDRIRKGVDYYIVVTTLSGLYRYFINDLVRVSGFLHRTPLLEFVQKGKGVTNITGEKLYESQVLAAVRSTMDQTGCALRFVLMLADEEAARYRLYIEAAGPTRPPAAEIAQSVDAGLMELNIEYRCKRESRRLAPLRAAWLRPGAADRYKDFCVSRGQREGQFKSAALAYRRDCPFDLDALIQQE